MATTRDRIIVATNELFRRQGYNGTSLSQISTASGATIGSIYHFFPGGKEALAVAVVDTTATVYRELFMSIAAAAATPASAYEDFFASAAAVLAESDYIDPCPIGGIAREVANCSEALREAAARAFELWIAAASDHLVRAGIAPDHAGELAATFVATVEGMFVLSRTMRSTAPLIAAGRQLSSVVQQAIDQARALTRGSGATPASH
jgi:AcrR family transcriptional regulator